MLEDDEEVTPIVKAADKLSAYIKCVEEQKAGNTEFDSAAKQSMESMLKMDMPELPACACCGAFGIKKPFWLRVRNTSVKDLLTFSIN